MNKKGILALVVVIVLVVVGYLAFKKSDSTMSNTSSSTPTTNTVPAGVTKDDYKPTTSASTDTSLIGRLKKASVGVTEDGKKVALVNGTATFSIADGSKTETGTVTLGDIAIEKTVNGRKDVLATLSVDLGGRGTFYYVVLFEDANGVLTDKSYGQLGDRVKVTGIRADSVSGSGDVEYVVTASYLDRKTGEPTATAPSVAHSKFFVVEKGYFNLAKTISL